MAGIYIHIPFCKQACTYCNFYFSTNTNGITNIIDAINWEIESRKNENENEPIETIYFGGGTPSLAKVPQLESILKTIFTHYKVLPNAEISIEVNPDDVNEETLKKYLQIGINRLSVGIQSFDNSILKLMNRAHNADGAKKCLADIAHAGFKNYSADLIYGNPNQTLEAFENDVETLLQFKPQHISCYALTVEPKTALNKWIADKKIPEPLPHLQSEMYSMLMTKLNANGYNHYEISNWALPNCESKHNSSYWNYSNYIGIGPSAHSFNGHSRRWNVSNNNTYLKAFENKTAFWETELLTDENKFNEYIMIKLRLNEGINKAALLNNFNNEWCMHAFKSLALPKNNTLVNITETHISLTKEGKFFADGLAANCFV
jgi:oxygen-independent coproporphyrinogen III oxidase